MLTMTEDDIRNAILAELKRRGWSSYKLVQEIGDRASPSSVYKYLAGERDINSTGLASILTALDLEIRPRK